MSESIYISNENKHKIHHHAYEPFLGGIDGCLLVKPPALVLVFIYQARLNAIYKAMLS